MTARASSLDYRRAGVDVRAAERLVPRFARLAGTTTKGSSVLSGVGPFAAAVRFPPGYREPVLLTATDGVGTKLLIAKLAGRHDTIGIDLVAMCVNDILTTGGRPLCFPDYLATGSLASIDAEAVVRGIADGCRRAGASLVGGETAEMPGMYGRGDYDLAGFAAGVVERTAMVTGRGVRPGQVVVGLPATGLHSNGYSLARAALGVGRRRMAAGLLDELLTPTAIYVKPVLAALRSFRVKAMAHVTGGGIPGNLIRVLPAGTAAVIDRPSLPTLEILERIETDGRVPRAEMERTFNSGVGFLLVVSRRHADALCEFFRRRRLRARVVGEILGGRRAVRFRGRK